MERARRKEQADRAYELQVKSGSWGAIKATLYGLALVTLTHHTWPLFRRQTLAIKGFLVSSCTIFGLVVGADTALLSHEAEHRLVEDRLRREARIELARQGKVATEPEIARWIARKEESAKETNQTMKG
ncbi:hypothetical protein JB92DRAFT_2709598 [Gautieria morchelliformis]|nr:hypothetical protein JB92DRAFT_2709598 [Gautieria morchelliformis]